MNKKLLALAVASVFSAPLVAQAQTANVTLYGRINNALETIKVESGGRATKIDSWNSRFGLKGTDSLGGGLNGVFQYEAGIASDQPGNLAGAQLVTREAWVGLDGGFGTVKLGTGLTPYDDVFVKTQLLYSAGLESQYAIGAGLDLGPGANFTSYQTNACNSANLDARYPNSIRYDSPDISGFKFATHYALIDETTTGLANGKCRGWDSKAEYSNGPLWVGLAYVKHLNFTGLGGSGLRATANNDTDAWRISPVWDFKVAKVSAAFDWIKYKGENNASGSVKVKYFNLGVQVPLGSAELFAQYHNRDKGLAANTIVGATAGAPTTSLDTVSDGGGRMFTIGAKYNFSKRTQVYGWATRLDPEAAAATNLGPADKNVTSFGVGAVVFF